MFTVDTRAHEQIRACREVAGEREEIRASKRFEHRHPETDEQRRHSIGPEERINFVRAA